MVEQFGLLGGLLTMYGERAIIYNNYNQQTQQCCWAWACTRRTVGRLRSSVAISGSSTGQKQSDRAPLWSNLAYM